MSDAPAQQKAHGRPPTHGHNSRVRVLKNRGLDAINDRTRAGKEAKRWKAWVMAQKGNGNSSPQLKNEIELASPKSERRELRERSFSTWEGRNHGPMVDRGFTSHIQP